MQITDNFLTNDEHKDQHKKMFEHRHLHALAKSATADGIEIPSLSGRVRLPLLSIKYRSIATFF